MKTLLLGSCAVMTLFAAAGAAAQPVVSYVAGSLAESTIARGPWTLHQGGPQGHDASGIVPTTSGPPYGASGTPYAGICSPSGQRTKNAGVSLMQPFYFPFVQGGFDGSGQSLVGLFDYRPRNEDEQTVAATSRDGGRSWTFQNAALGLNPYCPADNSDPDNLNLQVNGASAAYGSDSANAGDNGLGHPFAAVFGYNAYLYNLNRANNHIDVDQLVVHSARIGRGAARDLPAEGYVSPFVASGYPSLTPNAQATSGLVSPDAVLGDVPFAGGQHAFVYVSKALDGDAAFPACPSTPSFALTNLLNGKPRKANHDVTTLRVATTSDGLNFTDAGPIDGVIDSATVALNGIRYAGSGGVIPLADGRYGLFFGGGSCLDNDSDGFHFIGYAETVNPVFAATDLLNWRVINGLDNPIISTDAVTDPAGRRYPLNAPVVSDSLDRLTPAQVAPFQPPAAGYSANFFSGRAYGPQPAVTGKNRVTVVFAGYNTPQPSNNLGDYRTIGRFELKFPAGYLKSGKAPGADDD